MENALSTYLLLTPEACNLPLLPGVYGKVMKELTKITAVLLLLFCAHAASAQTTVSTKSAVIQQRSVSKTSRVDNKAPTTTAQLSAATLEYKANSDNVTRLQEEEIKKAESKLEQLRQLVSEGLVARNELAASEQSLADLKQKLTATRQQIADSERMVAELKAAEQTAKAQAAKLSASSRSLLTPTILRYNGVSSWTMAGLSGVQSFFLSSFGRSLPISALGQSATHDRLGYDHRNAVDVALHPDSAEGQALIAYLQRNGVPYLAFRSAVPGVATGPHIHIGSPSHRLG